MKKRGAIYLLASIAMLLFAGAAFLYIRAGFTPEAFNKKQLRNFPQIENIVRMLSISPDSVVKLDETETELIFCYITPHDKHQEQYAYVHALEDSGFSCILHDGTVVGAYELERDDISIKITWFDPEMYDFGYVQQYPDMFTGQNTVFHITKK